MEFKRLTPKKTAAFQKWARDNYVPFSTIEGIWHPVTQAECVKMNQEAATFV
jgi:hypothetical protein